MRHTENYDFPLYDPDAAPDLTETGEFDRSIVMIDEALKAEETARTDTDENLQGAIDHEIKDRTQGDLLLAEQLGKEAHAREDADTALGVRIDGKQDILVFATDDDIDSMDYKEF